MITLITGAPGSGKTLYCVDKIISPIIGTRVSGVDVNGDPAVYDRKVYSNINGLMLDHELVDADWLENLATNKQPGAFVVFDEVQRVWPNRPAGSKKPVAVEYLETHRHDGIDVVLMTQNPQLLDPAVRKLVGRHLHMRRVGGIGAAIVYEWDACSDTLRFKSAFTKTPYRYSRRAFRLYKSARVHTKQKRKLPFALWMALAGVAGAVFLWPHTLGRIIGKDSTGAKLAAAASGSGSSSAGPASAASSPRSDYLGQVNAALGTPAGRAQSAADYASSYAVRYDGMMHTAPRYDQLTQPTRVPWPAACIVSERKGCTCYTQDATRMRVPEATCRAIVADGLFLDFEPDRQRGERQAQAVSPGAVHWSTDGAPRAGSQPVPVPVPVTEREGITPGQIAALSRATTGSNNWARDAAVFDRARSSVAAPSSSDRPPAR